MFLLPQVRLRDRESFEGLLFYILPVHNTPSQDYYKT